MVRWSPALITQVAILRSLSWRVIGKLACATGSALTCYAILALLDKDDDLNARHELLNTERIL